MTQTEELALKLVDLGIEISRTAADLASAVRTGSLAPDDPRRYATVLDVREVVATALREIHGGEALIDNERIG